MTIEEQVKSLQLDNDFLKQRFERLKEYTVGGLFDEIIQLREENRLLRIENKELNSLIEKMKCCDNCKNLIN